MHYKNSFPVDGEMQLGGFVAFVLVFLIPILKENFENLFFLLNVSLLKDS